MGWESDHCNDAGRLVRFVAGASVRRLKKPRTVVMRFPQVVKLDRLIVPKSIAVNLLITSVKWGTNEEQLFGEVPGEAMSRLSLGGVSTMEIGVGLRRSSPTMIVQFMVDRRFNSRRLRLVYRGVSRRGAVHLAVQGWRFV